MEARMKSTFYMKVASNAMFEGNIVTAAFPLGDSFKFYDVVLDPECIFNGLQMLQLSFKTNNFSYPASTPDSSLLISIEEQVAFAIPLLVEIETNTFTGIQYGKLFHLTSELDSLLRVDLISSNSQIVSLDNTYTRCYMKDGVASPLVHFKSAKSISETNSQFDDVYGSEIIRFDEADTIDISKVGITNIMTT